MSRSISGDNVLSIRVLQKETQHITGKSISVLQKETQHITGKSISVLQKHNTTEHCTAQPGLSETIIGSTLRLRPFRRHRHRLTRCSPNTEFILLFWLFHHTCVNVKIGCLIIPVFHEATQSFLPTENIGSPIIPKIISKLLLYTYVVLRAQLKRLMMVEPRLGRR